MTTTNAAEGLDVLASKLFSAVVADALDAVHLPAQTMRPDIRPIHPAMRLMGRARTMRVEAVSRQPRRPYEQLISAMDALGQGDVIVASVAGGPPCALWGGLLSTAALAAGARGIVIDGCIRDSDEIIQLGFPAFVAGFSPADSLGRVDVTERDAPLECGGVVVQPGDLILADFDGVVVIPAEHEPEVIQRALAKVAGESDVRAELSAGMKMSAAFEKYGIL